MKHRSFLNYHEEYIPPVYDEETGEIIEPAHLLQWFRYRNFIKKLKCVSCSYKYIDNIL